MRDVAYVALGSNLGDRDRHLADARAAIARLPDSRLIAATPVEETEPIGPPGQLPYLNQMVAIETELDPRALLASLHAIERDAGRERSVRWGPRTLDLDIVALEHQTVADRDLVVPHPALPEREFWRRELSLLTQQSRADD